MYQYISLTECNTGITKNSPFAVNTAIKNQKATATSDSNGIWWAVSTNSVPLLSDAADIF
jgi:hypothetical protein